MNVNLIKNSKFWRTCLSYACVFVVGIIVFSSVVLKQITLENTQAFERNMHAMAQLIASSSIQLSMSQNPQQIQSAVDQFSQASQFRITIIASNGDVIADSSRLAIDMDNHLSRPEIQAARTQGLGKTTRFSQTLEEEFLYLAIPTANQWYVRVAQTRNIIQTAILKERTAIFKTTALVVLFILIYIFMLAYKQHSKIEDITIGAEQIAAGDFERRLSEDDTLGLSRLSAVINQMARTSASKASELTGDRNRLVTLFSGMVEGMIDVDQEQKIQYINEAACKLLNLELKLCIGKPIWQIVRYQKVITALEDAIHSQSVVRTQMLMTQGGESSVIDIYAASLSDDNGDPVGAVIVLHDITELKALERIRTDFVANASHELKTPITAIRGFAETTLDDEAIERETVLHFMSRIHAQSLRLTQLVNDLMTMSKLESSDNEAEYTAVSFTELLKGAAYSAQAQADEKRLSLQVNFPEQPLKVMGDRQHLSQLIDNLIDNAIKYSDIETDVLVTLEQLADDAVLCVKDSGIGISPQYQQRIFERFYRVDKARSQSLGGTGLGLSIVKNIAEKHGGSIEVESQLGKGSLFTVSIPLTK